MSLHFANGVNLRGMSPQIALAIQVAEECFAEAMEDCIITSLTRDGTFAECGYHATGNAVDIAVRRLDGVMLHPTASDGILRRLRTRIGREGGGQFDVVDERAPGASAGWTGAHIHIEFDPK